MDVGEPAVFAGANDVGPATEAIDPHPLVVGNLVVEEVIVGEVVSGERER